MGGASGSRAVVRGSFDAEAVDRFAVVSALSLFGLGEVVSGGSVKSADDNHNFFLCAASEGIGEGRGKGTGAGAGQQSFYDEEDGGEGIALCGGSRSESRTASNAGSYHSGGGGSGGGGSISTSAAAAAAITAAAAASSVTRPVSVSANAGLKAFGGLGALQWSAVEDAQLVAAIELLGMEDWTKIAQHVRARTAQQCMSRWVKALKIGKEKGPWTDEENAVILKAVADCAEGADGVRWADVSHRLPGRLGKQCRERWQNCLDPGIRRGPFEAEVRSPARRGFRAERRPSTARVKSSHFTSELVLKRLNRYRRANTLPPPTPPGGPTHI